MLYSSMLVIPTAASKQTIFGAICNKKFIQRRNNKYFNIYKCYSFVCYAKTALSNKSIMDEELKQQFEEMGVDPSAEVIAKSMDLCIDYNITDAVELVEQWIAFSISNLQGAEPTVESMREFERKVLQSTKKELSSATNKKSNKLPVAKGNLSHLNAVKVESKPLTIYGITKDATDDVAFNESVEAMDVEGAVLDTYNVYHTPKVSDESLIPLISWELFGLEYL